MAMSPLPAVSSSQPASGSRPAQDGQATGGFAQLFAQANQPGKTAGGAEGNSRSAANRPDEAHTDEQGDFDDAGALINDEAQALLSLPAQGNAALIAGESALPGSQADLLASATAQANAGGTGNGLVAGFAGDELAGIQERLDALARFRDNTPLNPLGQAIALAPQMSQQGGLERSLLSQAGGIGQKTAVLDTTDLKSGQSALSGSGVTATLTGNKDSSGALSGVSVSGNTSSANAGTVGGATLDWSQQLQTQGTSFAGTQEQAEGGDWLTSVSETLTAARTGTTETSSVMPLHAGAGLGAGQSAATASASVAQTPTLSAPLASAEWQQSLGQQLVNMQQRGDQRVQLHLHPAELGPLSIHLKVDDQMAQAQFMSTNPHVRAALEQAIPQLREALGEAGIQLGEAMVGDQQQGQEQGHDGTADARRVAAMGSGANSVTGDVLDGRALGDAGGLAISGVDLYA
ncbi:flagellar hook-length control protein FliK [Halomonas sp. HP20-15]|uniref:flagellar hook-length control protein FliK n=1 Tax=Halomonas sp. HP20-15 TaxID=3085901 RepID=UPI0029810D09|nr:flagellar hook-length control protein FliK [Halomonas sp. HP20-15]MDW5375713.1 flagellar hook-length control protein FliK [Halomonas sp. HP20-15]